MRIHQFLVLVVALLIISLIITFHTHLAPNSGDSLLTTYKLNLIDNKLTNSQNYDENNENPVHRFAQFFRSNEEIKDIAPSEMIGILDRELAFLLESHNNKKRFSTRFSLQQYRELLQEVRESKEMIGGWTTKIKNDFEHFNTLFPDMVRRDQQLVVDIITEETRILLEPITTGKELVSTIDFCNILGEAPRFACYKEILDFTATFPKEDVALVVQKFRTMSEENIITLNECHFSIHEIGYALGPSFLETYEVKCPEKTDTCAEGCLHGLGEYLFSSDSYDAKNNKFELERDFSENYQFELHSFYHGFGHQFFLEKKDLKDADVKCEQISNQEKSYYHYCSEGALHQFFYNSFMVENRSFEEAEGACRLFEENGRCYFHLGTNYPEIAGNQAAAEKCSTINNPYCVEGIGNHLEFYNRNYQKSVEDCQELIHNNRLLPYCYHGIVDNSLIFKNMTRAYLTCSLAKDRSCYHYIKTLQQYYTFFNDTIHFCEYVDESLQSQCYEETVIGNVDPKETF